MSSVSTFLAAIYMLVCYCDETILYEEDQPADSLVWGKATINGSMSLLMMIMMMMMMIMMMLLFADKYYRLGLDGEACVNRLLCEVTAHPMVATI